MYLIDLFVARVVVIRGKHLLGIIYTLHKNTNVGRKQFSI